MPRYASDVAFTPAVKQIQTEKGSRSTYARVEEGRGWQTEVTPELEAFIAELDMFYFGTSSAAGQPYVQYRGGSRGFLKVVDGKTLGFADLGGNRQYLSIGNLSENPRAFIFLMDYVNGRRVKLWGEARVVEDDPELLRGLADPDYPTPPERAILFEIDAWDVNCPQHIHRRVPLAEVGPAIERLRGRIAELEERLAAREPSRRHAPE